MSEAAPLDPETRRYIRKSMRYGTASVIFTLVRLLAEAAVLIACAVAWGVVTLLAVVAVTVLDTVERRGGLPRWLERVVDWVCWPGLTAITLYGFTMSVPTALVWAAGWAAFAVAHEQVIHRSAAVDAHLKSLLRKLY